MSQYLQGSSSDLLMDSKMSGNSLPTLSLSDVARRLRLYQSSIRKIDDTDHMSSSDCESRSKPRTVKRAAVLICIFRGDNGDLRVILTKRSSTLSSHSGEVALPGGKIEEKDIDDVATALREAKEEIGLDPTLVDVVCILDSIAMKSGMIVVPVVGLLHEKKAFQPAPNIAEVEAIFDAPLEMFLKDENRREVEKEWMGEKYLFHYFDYQSEERIHVIFALTAGILIETASIVYQQPPAFTEMKPKFWNNVNVNVNTSSIL